MNAKHLPPKLTTVVCCRMTPLQTTLYNHFLASKSAQTLLAGGKQKNVLASITALMKLVNHPMLIKEAKCVCRCPFIAHALFICVLAR